MFKTNTEHKNASNKTKRSLVPPTLPESRNSTIRHLLAFLHRPVTCISNDNSSSIFKPSNLTLVTLVRLCQLTTILCVHS